MHFGKVVVMLLFYAVVAFFHGITIGFRAKYIEYLCPFSQIYLSLHIPSITQRRAYTICNHYIFPPI